MRFWHSAEVSRTSNMAPKGIQEGCMPNLSTSTDVDGVEPDKDQVSGFDSLNYIATSYFVFYFL